MSDESKDKTYPWLLHIPRVIIWWNRTSWFIVGIPVVVFIFGAFVYGKWSNYRTVKVATTDVMAYLAKETPPVTRVRNMRIIRYAETEGDPTVNVCADIGDAAPYKPIALTIDFSVDPHRIYRKHIDAEEFCAGRGWRYGELR